MVGRHSSTSSSPARDRKKTRHHEIAIEGGAPPARSALGVLPHSDPELVERIERAVDATGDEPVVSQRAPGSLRRALTEIYNLTTPSRSCSSCWPRAAPRTWRRCSIAPTRSS
jgi:sulfite reductase alpha subunit-like flavoprotein